MTGPSVRSAPPFVDTHVHFFDLDLDRPLRWGWLEEPGPGEETLFGDLASVRTQRFTPPELLHEGTRLAGLQQCVHVQSALGTEDPVEETRWIQALQERYGMPAAHVAQVPMAASNARRIIEAHREHGVMRGARDPGGNSALLSPEFIANTVELGRHDLVFEIFCSPRRYDDLGALADHAPDTRFVLEHFGLPSDCSDPALDAWREQLHVLAQRDNVWIKLSGLGLVDPDWTWSAARRLVAEALDAFSPGRCVVGSNWPIDRSASSYPDVVLAITQDLSEDEKSALLCDNAIELYRLDLWDNCV